MIRKFCFAALLTFTASMIVQVIAISQASAQKSCNYTSEDKKKGYRC